MVSITVCGWCRKRSRYVAQHRRTVFTPRTVRGQKWLDAVFGSSKCTKHLLGKECFSKRGTVTTTMNLKKWDLNSTQQHICASTHLCFRVNRWAPFFLEARCRYWLQTLLLNMRGLQLWKRSISLCRTGGFFSSHVCSNFVVSASNFGAGKCFRPILREPPYQTDMWSDISKGKCWTNELENPLFEMLVHDFWIENDNFKGCSLPKRPKPTPTCFFYNCLCIFINFFFFLVLIIVIILRLLLLILLVSHLRLHSLSLLFSASGSCCSCSCFISIICFIFFFFFFFFVFCLCLFLLVSHPPIIIILHVLVIIFLFPRVLPFRSSCGYAVEKKTARRCQIAQQTAIWTIIILHELLLIRLFHFLSLLFLLLLVHCLMFSSSPCTLSLTLIVCSCVWNVVLQNLFVVWVVLLLWFFLFSWGSCSIFSILSLYAKSKVNSRFMSKMGAQSGLIPRPPFSCFLFGGL